jgi:hypothetical protein
MLTTVVSDARRHKMRGTDWTRRAVRWVVAVGLGSLSACDKRDRGLEGRSIEASLSTCDKRDREPGEMPVLVEILLSACDERDRGAACD